MSSSHESALPLSSLSIPNSFSSSSISESYQQLNEKLNIHQHVRRIPMRHRAWWLLLSVIGAGMLFAHVVWNWTPRMATPSYAGSIETDMAWDLGDPDTAHFVLPENVQVVALVSYVARSRTSILDRYLQNNLAINDGVLDQVIFVPETGRERDVDWLYALVQSTPGYFMLGKATDDSGDDAGSQPMAGDARTEVSGHDIGAGPFARAWNLALSTSQPQTASLERQGDDAPPLGSSSDPDISTIFIFIHGETVFLAADAIPHLLRTHLSHPSYAFVHANMINQPVLSWVHHHLGVVRPYRPETEPPIRSHRSKTTTREEMAKPETQYPWRASELPLWRDRQRASADETPSLFHVPIDFHSPFRGHRWLPYHPGPSPPTSPSPTEMLPVPASNDGNEDANIATPITQTLMSLQRPGRWPWTLSALHLYSFLEHLGCTPGYSHHHPERPSDNSTSTSTSTSPGTRDGDRNGKERPYTPACTVSPSGLARYDMGLWEYQTERYGTSLFAIGAATVRRIGALPAGVSDVEVLARAGRRGGGGGAAVDGGSVAVRFVGGGGDGDGGEKAEGEAERRGLESTDLLLRFESVSRELAGDIGGIWG